MKRLRQLIEHNVIPIVIFDGGPLPMKQAKEQERRQSRDEYKARGICYLKEGNLAAANECFQKAVDITPEMAFNLIKVITLLYKHVTYLIAKGFKKGKY
jgi:exonuclease-1